MHDCGTLAAPLSAEAQVQVPHIGYLSPLSATDVVLEAFRQGLRELGYVEGQTIVIEYRFAEGRPERLPALAAELVRAHVDVMVTPSTPATVAAMQTTNTIPIVSPTAGNLVATGIVKSLALCCWSFSYLMRTQYWMDLERVVLKHSPTYTRGLPNTLAT